MPEAPRFYDVAPAVTPPETLTAPEQPLTPAEQLLVSGIETVTTNEGFRRWLDVAAKFHEYSLHNQILIAMQKPEATKVMGFRKWGEVGRHVLKGEHAIKIFYPQFGLIEQEDEQTGEKTKHQVLRGFGIGNVFDVSQTEGDPLPEGPTFGDLNESNAIAREVNLRLSRYLIDDGVKMESKDYPGGALGFYVPAKKQIVIRRSVYQDEETGEEHQLVDPLNLMKTKTLVHEMAHYVLDHDYDRVEKADAEISAEGAAYIALQRFGLDTSHYSFVYAANWGGTRERVMANLEAIRYASGVIVKAAEETDPFATELVSPSQ